MELNQLEQLTQKELSQFKSVCNYLLGHTYLLRNLYPLGKPSIPNADYHFLERYHVLVEDYLSLLDWQLHHDPYRGYYYISNGDEVNRRTLDPLQTKLLLALRLIYEDNQEDLNLDSNLSCTVRDVLDMMVSTYQLIKTRPNMTDIRRAFAILDNHCITQRIDGSYGNKDCNFIILPTILTAVSNEKLNAVMQILREETDDEETESSSIDELAPLQEDAD